MIKCAKFAKSTQSCRYLVYHTIWAATTKKQIIAYCKLFEITLQLLVWVNSYLETQVYYKVWVLPIKYTMTSPSLTESWYAIFSLCPPQNGGFSTLNHGWGQWRSPWGGGGGKGWRYFWGGRWGASDHLVRCGFLPWVGAGAWGEEKARRCVARQIKGRLASTCTSPLSPASEGWSNSGFKPTFVFGKGEYMAKKIWNCLSSNLGILKLSVLMNQKIFKTVYRNFLKTVFSKFSET